VSVLVIVVSYELMHLRFRGARRSNATLPVSDLDEPLQVVLKANGEKSELFPTNLRSLFSYDSMSVLCL
jgi:hypothetical protein